MAVEQTRHHDEVHRVAHSQIRSVRTSMLPLVFCFLLAEAPFAEATQQGSRIERLTVAADRGEAVAQLALGRIFDEGDGVPENDHEAYRWYRAAAEQGLSLAQYLLAQMYQNGVGKREPDPAQALKWYTKAAEQADVRAQFSLSVLYANGEGVEQDDLKAYMWANLAAAAGSTLAMWQKDILSSRMTKKQVAEAQKLSSEWQLKQADGVASSSAR